MKAYVVLPLILIVGLIGIFSSQWMLGKSEMLAHTNALVNKDLNFTIPASKKNNTVPLSRMNITNSSEQVNTNAPSSKNKTSVPSSKTNSTIPASKMKTNSTKVKVNSTKVKANLSNFTIIGNNTNSTNSTNSTEQRLVPFSAEYNKTHFGTCPNTPGRNDLYWITKEYAISTSHTAHLYGYQPFITEKHTDMRFAKKRIYGGRRELLTVIFRDFARWCDDHQIQYFIGHGTLLGWYWNERILLWDQDLDIIVDWPTFTYLLQFNNTIIEGRYKLELNACYPYRGYGGLNVIDGMFIDTQTGVYIDITMLSETKFHVNTTDQRFVSETPNCLERNCIEDKSVHRYAYDVIYPLKRITFEGVGTWAPNNIEQHLDQEYTIKGRLLHEFYEDDHIGVDGPARPQIIKSSPSNRPVSVQYMRYGFDYELNDWVITEVSERKKKDMIDNNEPIPVEDKKCLPAREVEYMSTTEPAWLPLWHYCRAKTEKAKKLVALKYKVKFEGEIDCAACVRPMPQLSD